MANRPSPSRPGSVFEVAASPDAGLAQPVEQRGDQDGVAGVVELELVDADQPVYARARRRLVEPERADEVGQLDEGGEQPWAGRCVPQRGEQVRLADAVPAVEVDPAGTAGRPARFAEEPRPRPAPPTVAANARSRVDAPRLGRLRRVGTVGVEADLGEPRRRHQLGDQPVGGHPRGCARRGRTVTGLPYVRGHGPSRDAARAADAGQVGQGHPRPGQVRRRAALRAEVGRLPLHGVQATATRSSWPRRNTKPLTRYFPEVVDGGAGAAAGAVRARRRAVRRRSGDRLEFEVLQERIHPAESRVSMLAEKTPASASSPSTCWRSVTSRWSAGRSRSAGRGSRQALAGLDRADAT